MEGLTSNGSSTLPPQYYVPTVWEIEKSFSEDYWNAWFKDNWRMSFLLCSIYLAGLRLGSDWMKSRQRFQLTGALFLWNLGLAIFSIVGSIRTFPELIQAFGRENGVHSSLCLR